MVQPQKTPSQHNSTLYISPLITNRHKDVFITPTNAKPLNSLFESPNSNHSLFFHFDRSNNQTSHNMDLGGSTNSTHNAGYEPLTQVEKLRLWRHDALMQHQYKTAEFIGDKVLTLTDDPKDAFWLAQVYFNSGNYLRAKRLLTRKLMYEKAVSCRYLAAYSLVKLEQWDEALDLIGETNPFIRDDNYQVKSDDGGIKLEASMCYLRGLVYANRNNFERAKECYKEACLIDVKCYEAFNELISNDLMTPGEQWEFINSLNFRDADNNDELIKLLYTSKLSKYLNGAKFEEADSILREEFELGDNCDLLLNRADYLYVQCNFDECLEVCEKIIAIDEFNFDVIPDYLSCLHELGAKNKLFLKAHLMAENHPSHPMTWLAIGIYYLSINKIVEARKFFSKATILSPNFGQAWIGFAHTFASEGEHEQAISAYAFAARLFPGTHLPNLFLGMQHLQMNNLGLAEEYLLAAYQICNADPLLLNELGVINFRKNDLVKAELFLQEALVAAKNLNSDSRTWVSIHSNLGHVNRRGRHYYKALDCFNQVLRISNKNDSNLLSSIALIHLQLGDYSTAIDTLHNALAISPNDHVASDILNRVLEANLQGSSEFFARANDLIRRQLHGRLPPRRPQVLRGGAPPPKNHPRSTHDDRGAAEMADQLRAGEPSSDEGEEVMEIE